MILWFYSMINSQRQSINSLQIDMSFVMRRLFQKCTGDAAHFLETSICSQMALTYPQVGCLYIQCHLKCLHYLHCPVSKSESFSPVVQLFERKMDGFWDENIFTSLVGFFCPLFLFNTCLETGLVNALDIRTSWWSYIFVQLPYFWILDHSG